MKIIKGKYNEATVFTDNIDYACIEQVKEVCGQKAFEGEKIRIMPDCHAGKGCVVGFTSTFSNKIIPNIVGVDLFCGMLTINLFDMDIDYSKLDDIIHTKIPSGRNAHSSSRDFDTSFLKGLKAPLRNKEHIENSIGTLGGGNHFIEVGVDNLGRKYLVIHTGSRNLGTQVANYYQELAVSMAKKVIDTKAIIEVLKKEGRAKEIESVLKEAKRVSNATSVNKEFAYLSDAPASDYLHDANICRYFASYSRNVIADIILDNLGIDPRYSRKFSMFDRFETLHNYIGEDGIIRKGAISAKKDEIVLIPINMRDGSLVCRGKGNPDYNYSAPHGAGRIMSRSQAKTLVTLEEFQESMKGIYTSSVNQSTIDESPMAYKPIEDILGNIQDTVDVLYTIKPVYNFKASE